MMRRTALMAALAALLLVAGFGLAIPTAKAQDTAPANEASAEATTADITAERAEAAGHGYSEETAASGGMPQLNAESFASQIFWVIITFSALFYLLKTKALPRVADILEARQERISNDLDKAAALRAEAEAAAEEYAKVLASAQSKASDAIKQTRDAVAADIAARGAALDKELAARISAAEANVAKARQQALTELEAVAIDVAQVAAQRLAGIEVSAAEAKAALHEVQQSSAKEVA